MGTAALSLGAVVVLMKINSACLASTALIWLDSFLLIKTVYAAIKWDSVIIVFSKVD